MSKIGIITDTHFGIKNDANFMLDHQEKFLKFVFIPYLIKNGIDTIWHLGDLFDRRKYINFNTLYRTRKMFLDVLAENNIRMYIIPGNHCVHVKNTNEINSLDTLLGEYANIMVISRPTTIMFDKTPIMFIPWLNLENGEECIKHMDTNPDGAKLVCGHFEIEGFEMYRGIKNEHGMPVQLFNNFDQVFSGHFHLKSSDGNITYLGAPFQFTWADWNEAKGFHTYDTETTELEFVANPYTLYEKVYYDDEQEDYNKFDVDQLEGKIVQLVVNKKSKPAVYEAFLDRLYKTNVIDLKVMELTTKIDVEDSTLDEIKSQSTRELIDTYINEIETDLSRDKLKSIFSGLYIEAVHQAEES